jgi:3-deoxy-D-manno-octulosonic acid kinase
MALRALLSALPDGYEVVRGLRGWLACERDARATLERSGFGPDGGETLPVSDLAGRGSLGAIDTVGERWVVRHFRHGGLLRSLGEHVFLQPARPFHELCLSSALRSAGLPTPRVVAARAVRAAPLGWRLALVSARIEGGVDGATFLERMRKGECRAAERRRFLRGAGELVGRLHARGFLHADLHPRNLLFAPDLSEGWVLDLDRGRLVAALGLAPRRDNLRRLYRSVRRREARGQPFVSRADYRRFLAGYAVGLGAPHDWRADWRAILRRDRWRAPVHRLGWWLEERFGSGPAERDGAGSRPG